MEACRNSVAISPPPFAHLAGEAIKPTCCCLRLMFTLNAFLHREAQRFRARTPQRGAFADSCHWNVNACKACPSITRSCPIEGNLPQMGLAIERLV